MKLESTATIVEFSPFETSTTSTHNLGESLRTADRRTFRYGRNGASGVTKGKLSQAPAPKTNHHNVAVAVPAASGDQQVTVTLGNTAAVANEYAEGYFALNDNGGEGQVYKVSGHPAASGLATLLITLFDVVATALTTSSEGTLVHNPYNLAVEAAASTRRPAGVPLIDLAASAYGWYQTFGVAAVLCDTTTTLGAKQKASGSVAGAVTDMTDILGSGAEVEVGTADILAGVDTEFRAITLTIG